MNVIDTTLIWNGIVQNTEITSFLTENDIVTAGFVPVKFPQSTIEGVHYTCCRQKLIPITEKSIFEKEYTKEMVIRLIKECGFTHIRNIEMHCFPFFFGSELKNAITIMIEGFTKRKG